MPIFKKQRLEGLALIHGETRLLDCLDLQNSLHLQPEHFQQLKTLLGQIAEPMVSYKKVS